MLMGIAALGIATHGCASDDPQSPDSGVQTDATDVAPDTDTSVTESDSVDAEAGPGDGLAAAATVYRDQWGVAHIYAENRADLFYLQGYEMARDRLWHLDFLRHFIYGTQSSVFGAEFLEDDLLKRGLGIRAIVERNEANYRENYPDVHAEIEAYTRGVNQYLADAMAGTNGASMPSEFSRIPGEYAMRAWEVYDTLAIAKALLLSQSFQPDLELVAFAGLTLLGDQFRELYPFTPLMPAYALEEEPSSQDDLSTDWRADGERDKSRREPGYLAPEVVEAFAAAIDSLVRATGRDDISGLGGSNAFAVADDMSTNGHAMLCNDTHMTMDLPSTLYPMHLVVTGEGGFDSFGYDAPGSPYTLIGTNEQVSWALTNAYGDVTDLYREEFSDDGMSVLYNGEFVPLQIIDEPIAVRNPDGSLDESYRTSIRVVPHHGPILNDVLPGDIGATLNNFGFVFSIRWTGFNDQTSELVTFSRMLGAETVGDAIDVFERFDGGVMNLTFADSTGAIAYIPAGPFPQRNWDLTDTPPYLPLPGTGDYEWDARIPYDTIPRLVDPAKGYLANANASISDGTFDNVPETGDFYFHHFVDLGTRAWRLTQRLEEMKAAGGASMADLRALQLDNYSVQASIYVPVITDAFDDLCPDADNEARCEAIALLRDWDFHQDADSVASTLYNQWVLYFWWETYVDDVSSLVFDLVASDLDNGPGRGIGHWLLGRPPVSGTNYFDDSRTADVEEDAVDIAVGALDQALTVLDAYYEGAPMSDWRWDEAHFVRLTHQVWEELDHGPFGIGSGGRTVNAADFRLVTDGEISTPPFFMNEAPQIRFCAEMTPDGPIVLGGLMGGASARGDSPHYLDQFDNWLNGIDIPIAYTRPAVEADAQNTVNYPVGFPGVRPE
jgi:penicillin amidase